MKKQIKDYIQYPFFIDTVNEKEYIFMIKDKAFVPFAKKEVELSLRDLENIIEDIFYGEKIEVREKKFLTDNIQKAYAYISTLNNLNQQAYLKKLSSYYGYPLSEFRKDYLLSTATEETEAPATEETEAPATEETEAPATEEIDTKMIIEREERLAHYKKFDSIRLFEYIEIKEKIDTKKERYYTLKVMNREVVIPSAELFNQNKLSTALSKAVRGTTVKRASFLCEYLEQFDENIKVPIIRGVTRTGWIGNDFFIPNRENRKIKLMTNEDGLKKRYSQKGDIENSKHLLYKMSYKKSFIAFMAVLTSPMYGLIDDMGMLNHSTHISGGSGKGKTLSIHLALSLFGNPKEYKSNFSQTLVGAEMYLAENYDMPCFIDETESAKRVDDIIETFYMFSNKNGKARGTMSGNEVIARDIVNFRGHLLTSGEKSLEPILEQSFSEDNKKGAIRRVVDFEVDSDYLKSFNSDIEYDHSEMMELKRIAYNNYGLFVDEWIKILSENKKKINNDFAEISRKLNRNLADKELVYYAFILVLKVLFENGYIPKESYIFQYKNIIKMLNDETEKRNDVRSPEVLFFEKFKEYVAMNKGKFGQGDFITGEQIGEYSSNRENLYVTKSGFNSILKDFKMSGAKKEIRNALVKSGILRERSSVILGSPSSIKHLSFDMRDKKEASEIISELKKDGKLTVENQNPNELF